MRDIIRQKIVDSVAMPLPSFTRRDVHLPASPRKALAVSGMRRSGKTTLLWQVIADGVAHGTPREGFLYLSLEDERLFSLTVEDLSWVVEEYYRLYPEWRDGRQATFMLDEVQTVPGWEAFARRLLDTEQVRLFLSGSSARLLSRELATSMRGRALEVRVFPFSFREYLRHLRREPHEQPQRLPKGPRARLERDLRDYLAGGGFPEAVGLDARTRADLLRSYVDVAVLRDVIERYGVSQPVALSWMVRHLLGNPAGLFSVNKFYADLRAQGVAVSKDTLHAYLGHLQDAFLVRMVEVAAGSERRRMVNPRKFYPIDPGLIPIYDRAGRANVGHALETVVYLELERRGAEVAYVRTVGGREVDFLARYADGGEALVQVCADVTEPEVRTRELQGLMKAHNEHPRARLQLVTLDPPRASLPDGVELYAASDWLLQQP